MVLTVGEDEIQALSQCNVHAGYSGNVMRLSIAGLRYWNELGLEPVGGRKDITAFVVCEVGDGYRRAAVDLLRRMQGLYVVCCLFHYNSRFLLTCMQECRLGTHSQGEAPMASEGVIAIPAAGFADSIGRSLLGLIDGPLNVS